MTIELLAVSNPSKNYKFTQSSESTIVKLQKKLTNLTQDLKKAQNKIESLTNKLEKEKELRVKLHIRTQLFRQELYRTLYDLINDKTTLDWVEGEVENNPNWGLRKTQGDVGLDERN